MVKLRLPVLKCGQDMFSNGQETTCSKREVWEKTLQASSDALHNDHQSRNLVSAIGTDRYSVECFTSSLYIHTRLHFSICSTSNRCYNPTSVGCPYTLVTHVVSCTVKIPASKLTIYLGNRLIELCPEFPSADFGGDLNAFLA